MNSQPSVVRPDPGRTEARPPVLRVAALVKAFGSARAVDRIDLDVQAGEFLTIVGPSGCGKTTLLRMLAGLEVPSSGDILLNGARINDLPPNKRPTCMVFQSLALFPHRSVGENIAFPLKVRSVKPAIRTARALDLMKLMRLPADYFSRNVMKCSGGERQRVALARAFAYDPEILFFDEPLSALDYKLKKSLEKELKDIHKETGKTFVYITHSLEEAMVMSDRIAVMFDGEIAQLDEPERLYRKPASQRVANFIGTMNFLPARVLSGSAKVEVDVQGLGRVSLDAGQVSGAAIGGMPVVGFRPETLTILFEGQAPADREAMATVEEVVYYGDMTYYDVKIDGTDQQLRLSMRNVFGRPVLDIGARARVAWAPGALVLFR